MTSARVAMVVGLIAAAFLLVFHVPQGAHYANGQGRETVWLRIVFPDGESAYAFGRHDRADTLEHGTTIVELKPELSGRQPMLAVRTIRFYGPRAASPVQTFTLSPDRPATTIHGWVITLTSPPPDTSPATP